MRTVVTGYKGFIGSHLIKRLDAIGIDVLDGNDILDCDLPNADVVIHLAAISDVIESVDNPTQTVRNNIEGTVRLLKYYPNAKFIFASSGGTIQDDIASPYGMSKYCAEEFIKMMHPNNYVILRFGNVFGPGGHCVIDKFINGDVNIYGDGSATRTYTHVDDIVTAILLSLDWASGTYLLGGAKTYTVDELANATGKPITYMPKREGELDHATVANTTPNWQPTIDAKEYICSQL